MEQVTAVENRKNERSAAEREISAYLIEKYGPLLGRDALTTVLKFRSGEALDRYIQRGHLPIGLVRMPHRRSIFALATDVAAYLVTISSEGVETPQGEGAVDDA